MDSNLQNYSYIGIILFECKNLSIGIFNNKNILLKKEDTYFTIETTNRLLISLLPILELNYFTVKRETEERLKYFDLEKLDFNKIFFVNNLILTAFEGKISMYWKKKALDWLIDSDIQNEKIKQRLEYFCSYKARYSNNFKKKAKEILNYWDKKDPLS